jgi:two-component system sensor histidine kinase/response regulator
MSPDVEAQGKRRMNRDIGILIAEDSPLVSKMTRRLLEQSGYRVVGQAESGVQAVEMAQSLHPDVVLMDIQMPDMDGIEATRRIQERRPTPVVVVTAFETPDLVTEASQAGVGAYLAKPASAHEIDRAITIAMARFDDMVELRRLNAELQAQNEDLNAFAHTVAHDLKSPLSLITGYADLLIDNYAKTSDAERQDYLGRVLRTGHKMSNIIDELLLFAGVRQERVEIEPIETASIVDEALQRLRHMVEEYQAVVVLPGEWPMARGYGPWVEEVWVNYMSNAIKYGGRPPQIELGAREQEGGTVRFWVSDNGSGLSVEEQSRLFTPFTRLSQVHVKGHGLGLSIVRRIVEKLGGEVGVESRVGQGSVFSFTLPKSQDSEDTRHGQPSA